MKDWTVLEPDLLERAQRFDRQALAQVYDLYSPGLYRYAFRLLGDARRAEDCVAETFSRFLAALRQGKGPRDHLQAYLYRVAHNLITDSYRRGPPPETELQDTHPAGGETPEEWTLRHARRERLRLVLSRLTPDQRQVILLKFAEEWDNEQVAELLQKPVGAVKSLQHRALERLKHMLHDEDLI